jgi:hypothetical protein
VASGVVVTSGVPVVVGSDVTVGAGVVAGAGVSSSSKQAALSAATAAISSANAIEVLRCVGMASVRLHLGNAAASGEVPSVGVRRSPGAERRGGQRPPLLVGVGPAEG